MVIKERWYGDHNGLHRPLHRRRLCYGLLDEVSFHPWRGTALVGRIEMNSVPESLTAGREHGEELNVKLSRGWAVADLDGTPGCLPCPLTSGLTSPSPVGFDDRLWTFLAGTSGILGGRMNEAHACRKSNGLRACLTREGRHNLRSSVGAISSATISSRAYWTGGDGLISQPAGTHLALQFSFPRGKNCAETKGSGMEAISLGVSECRDRGWQWGCKVS